MRRVLQQVFLGKIATCRFCRRPFVPTLSHPIRRLSDHAILESPESNVLIAPAMRLAMGPCPRRTGSPGDQRAKASSAWARRILVTVASGYTSA